RSVSLFKLSSRSTALPEVPSTVEHCQPVVDLWWERIEPLCANGSLAEHDRSSYGRLSVCERIRCDRFRSMSTRSHYISAHTLLRAVCAHHTGETSIAFRYERSGRPRVVVGRLQPSVTLTHTSGCVACAVGSLCHVGVDCERVQ